MDFTRTAPELHNRLRGFQPWPGVFTAFRGKVLNVLAARPADASVVLAAGEVAVGSDVLLVGCRDSVLAISELQLEGKRRMSARDFINGYRPHPGEVLGG